MIVYVHICNRKMDALLKLRNCKKIKPYADYYKQQIKTYNDTAYHILKNVIDLILPQHPTKEK